MRAEVTIPDINEKIGFCLIVVTLQFRNKGQRYVVRKSATKQHEIQEASNPN